MFLYHPPAVRNQQPPMIMISLDTSHNSVAERTGLSISSVQRAIKCLCDRGLLSYRNRFDEKGHKQTNLYQINLSRLQELTALPENVVSMTPMTGGI